MDIYPLDILLSQNEELQKKIMNSSDCILSTCWRGYEGTWQIVNDSLFLVKLESGCGSKEIDINLLFDKSTVTRNGVFADWFSRSLKVNYGKLLDFDELRWTSIYEGIFECYVNSGLVSNVKIEMKDSSLINKIITRRSAREDTMAYLIVDEYPILIADDKEYKLDELKDFILRYIRYPSNDIDCMGTVFISFIVEKDGSVTNKRFMRKLCDGYNEEAMKVIDMMTNWKPGLAGGDTVRTQLCLPLKYKY